MKILLFVKKCSTIDGFNFDLTNYGFAIALISIVSSSLQQYYVRSLQLNYKLTALQLLSMTAPLQGISLFAIGPLLDKAITSKWILYYSWSAKAFFLIAISGILAIIVNLSQFICLGKFSTVSFQVSKVQSGKVFYPF